MESVPQAALARIATVLAAQGERSKRELEGKGAAAALRVLLEAKAAGYEEIATKLGIEEKDLVLIAETIRDALQGANYTILGAGGSAADIFGIVSAIKSVLGKT